jgi:Spy/CpxP family protein refolding chaperone
MKKLVMVALAAALFAAPVMAQDKEKDHAEWENKVKTELKLTPEQTTQYDAISADFKGKVDALKSDNTLTAETRDQRKMELKKEKVTKINAILTPEQQTKFAELMDKKKKKMKKENPEKS